MIFRRRIRNFPDERERGRRQKKRGQDSLWTPRSQACDRMRQSWQGWDLRIAEYHPSPWSSPCPPPAKPRSVNTPKARPSPGALAKVPPEALKWRPAPGKWSVHEIIIHCADSEANAHMRVRYLLAEKDPGSWAMTRTMGQGPELSRPAPGTGPGDDRRGQGQYRPAPPGPSRGSVEAAGAPLGIPDLRMENWLKVYASTWRCTPGRFARNVERLEEPVTGQRRMAAASTFFSRCAAPRSTGGRARGGDQHVVLDADPDSLGRDVNPRLHRQDHRRARAASGSPPRRARPCPANATVRG